MTRSELLNFFSLKSFCSLLNFVTLGFASSVALCCLVFTIFYVFGVTSNSSAVIVGEIAGAIAGVTEGELI